MCAIHIPAGAGAGWMFNYYLFSAYTQNLKRKKLPESCECVYVCERSALRFNAARSSKPSQMSHLERNFAAN